jgi:hypothetical protein
MINNKEYKITDVHYEIRDDNNDEISSEQFKNWEVKVI